MTTVTFPDFNTSTFRTVETVTTYAAHVVQRQEFAVKDDKGRTVGAYVHTWEETFVDATPEQTTAWDVSTKSYRDDGAVRVYRVPAGTYYNFCASATRAGAGFGASQGARHYATAEARDKAIAKYFADAQKRANKAWAKAASAALDDILAKKY